MAEETKHGASPEGEGEVQVSDEKILEAARNGDRELVSTAIDNSELANALVPVSSESGANIEAANKHGWTPGLRASEDPYKVMVSGLRECVANVEAASMSEEMEKGSSPKNECDPRIYDQNIWEAAKVGDEESVNLLLERGANIDAMGLVGETPLLRAALNGHKEVVSLLLDGGANIEAGRFSGETPLHAAAVRDHKEVVSLLLDRGANSEAGHLLGGTPLVYAARNGHTEVVSVLLERGANIEAADKDGWTPLLCAALSSHTELVSHLLERGANVEAVDSRFRKTPLHLATLNGHKEMVSLLLERGANIESAEKDGWSPLHFAAANDHKEMVSLLLERGANTEAANKSGWTPLHRVAQKGHKESASLLLERGANIEAANKIGWSPLRLAHLNRRTEVAMLLIERGASFATFTTWPISSTKVEMNSAPDYAETLLHRAAEIGHKDVVSALLAHGANIEAASDRGWTPLHLAAEKGQKEVVAVLLEHGADIEASDYLFGRMPHHVAALNGHKEVVSLLLERGANIQAADKYERASPLHHAAGNGHKEVVSLLSEQGANIEAANKYGWTPLHRAAFNGHKEVVSFLLERGANIEAANKHGWTPLSIASLNRHADVVLLLLKSGAHVAPARSNVETFLHHAAVNGQMEAMYLLLEHGASIEAADKHKRTPLHHAAANGQIEVVSLLLERGANIEAVCNTAWTPVHHAAFSGYRGIVSLLLERGANIETVDEYASTPIHDAVANGHEEVVSLLLERGANIEAANIFGWSPLHFAASFGHKELASLLLERGAKIEARVNHGWTPIHLAAENGHNEVVTLLLEHGADIESASGGGWTPLHRAAENGHNEVVSLLLERGANVGAAEQNGRTPLHSAAGNGHNEVVSLLLEGGANIEAAEQDGWTPLHHAVAKGHKMMVSLLLERGANIEALNNDGETPFYVAASSWRDKELVPFLWELGANVEAADKDGLTPLYRAAWDGRVEWVSLLLDCGAKVTTFVFPEGLSRRRMPQMTTPLHYMVSSASDEKLAAVLHELKGQSISDEDVLRSVDSSLVAVLLARDGNERAVVDFLHARLSESKSPWLASIAGIFGDPAVKVLLQRLPIPFARVYLCGPGGAGKTLLRCQLQGDISGAHDLETKPILETRTRSVHISPATLHGVTPSSLKGPQISRILNMLQAELKKHTQNRSLIEKYTALFLEGLMVQIFDFGGQQEFEVTYLQLLRQALSIFLLTMPVCPAGLKCPGANGGEHYIMEPTTYETTKRDLKHWLSLLSTVAHPIANQVLVVVNVFDGVDPRTVKRHEAAVKAVLKEYSTWAETGPKADGASSEFVGSGAQQEGGHDGKQTRLNLVGQGFVVLNYKSSIEWADSNHENGTLFSGMCTAWGNLRSLEESHGVDLSMPKLCSDLLVRIPEFRQTRPPIDTARNAREAVRRTMGGVFENLSDKAVDALLGYVETCGEVLLKYPKSEKRDGEQRGISHEDVVIWKPNWFLSSVVGEFFQPLAWRKDAFLDVRMRPQDVRDVLRFPVEDAMPDVDDEEMERILSTLMALMKDMQLCAYVRTRTNAEYWFPLFLNSPDLRICLSSDEARRKKLPIERGVLQDHLPAKEILYAQFEDLKEDAWNNEDCRLRGRLMSIRDLRDDVGSDAHAGAASLDWRIVLPGSFERFMARVLEAFPSETEDHVKLFMTPNLIQLTWRSSSKAAKCAHVQCQMIHEQNGIKVAWIAWVWASDDEAAAHLLKGDPSTKKDVAHEDATLQVIEQVCGWMQEASRDHNVIVLWREYPLQSTAFLRSGSEVFQAGHRYLATCEWEFLSCAEEVKSGGIQAGFQDDEGDRGSSLKSAAEQEDQQSVLRFTKASFNLLKNVGEGAYGTVWRAVEVGRSGPEYAIKEMKTKDMSPTQLSAIQASFEAEVRNLRAARHENVVTLVDYFTSGNTSPPRIAIVTLFAPLGSFDDVMSAAEDMYLELHPDDKVWEPLQTLLSPDVRRCMLLKALKDIASGLEYLHSVDIIHRDVKPANILLFPPFTAKLSDFGTSKHVPQAKPNNHTVGVGTPAYMAPEVRTGCYSFAADCSSFGIVLHEASWRLLTPLGSASEERRARVYHHPRSLPDSAQDLKLIWSTCVQDVPEARYDTRGFGPKLSKELAAFEPVIGDETLTSLSELLQAYNRVDLSSEGGC